MSRDVSPIRSQLQTPWEKASERTKRYYTRKAGQGVAAVLQDITDHVRQAPCSAHCVPQTWCPARSPVMKILMTTLDVTLMEALVECYHASGTWETRRQILSIMADKVRYRALLRYIPGLTKYRFTEAKRHCLAYGRGSPVQSLRTPRTDITSTQIEHFIAFITSSHIVQDLFQAL